MLNLMTLKLYLLWYYTHLIDYVETGLMIMRLFRFYEAKTKYSTMTNDAKFMFDFVELRSSLPSPNLRLIL